MPEIDWTISPEDQDLLLQCVERQFRDKDNPYVDKMSMQMDLTACHANGCPMDFAKLLNAPKFDFKHDVIGIYRHVSRTDGTLAGFFLPRCARPVSDTNGKMNDATKS
jgi:hypothetical protein